MTPTLAPSPPLMAADRCDRCGAQAYIRVVLASGGELLFCAHHGKQYEPRLRTQAADWHDESERLAATSPTATAEER